MKKIYSKKEMDRLAYEATQRQLTTEEVQNLHETARHEIDTYLMDETRKEAIDLLKSEMCGENITAQMIEKKVNDLLESKKLYFNEKLLAVDVWNHMQPKEFLDSIEFHVSDSCNLNCTNCGHFSNLAEKHTCDVETFRKDLKRFIEIMGEKLKGVILIGGEPLLNPDIRKFITSARELFPTGNLLMFTNGILLNTMPENFWKTCSECKLDIIVSAYPIEIHIEEISAKAKEYGVKISFADRHEDNWLYWYLDLQGTHDITKNFILCSQANNCHQIRNGRLYPCSVAAYVDYFNKKFNTNLVLSDEDSLDLSQSVTAQDVLNFLSRPVPFCRYCKREIVDFGLWKRSTGELSEWLNEDK